MKRKKPKKFKEFDVTKWKQDKEVKSKHIDERNILASGSMVIRGKPGNLLGPESLRNMGSEVAIMQHNGEKLAKKLKKKQK